jgi:hypothetical protein
MMNDAREYAEYAEYIFQTTGLQPMTIEDWREACRKEKNNWN